MNDGDALLTAILADPGDDTPRLVYADWLQENGQDERAEFIRLQIEYEVIRQKGMRRERVKGGRDKRIAAINKRVDELLFMPAGPEGGTMLCRWLGLASHADYVEWDRGFVWSVTCRADFWEKFGDEVLTQHPISRVVLRTLPKPFAYRIDTGGVAAGFEWLIAGQWVPLAHVGRTDDWIKHALEARWKVVAFEVPNRVFADYTPWLTRYAEMQGAMERQRRFLELRARGLR